VNSLASILSIKGRDVIISTGLLIYGEDRMDQHFEILIQRLHDEPASKTLPQVARLARRGGVPSLEGWARLELLGYWDTNPAMTEDVIVPEYRTVVGEWRDDFGRSLRITDDSLSFINSLRLRLGVVELESFFGATGLISYRPNEFSEIINKEFGIEVTTFSFDPRLIPSILAAIKMEASDRLVAEEAALAPVLVNESPVEAGIIELKPSFYGISVDLKALWRRIRPKRSPGN
jgi:hypothetical protein